jgi:Choline/ethanolamine kinase
MVILSQDNVEWYLNSLNIFDGNADVVSIEIGRDIRKNFGLFVSLRDGRKILVKQERPSFDGYFPQELVNEWSFQELIKGSPHFYELKNVVNDILFYDTDNIIAVYSYLDNYTELYTGVLMTEAHLPEKVSSWIGHSIALIHKTTYQSEEARILVTKTGSFWDKSHSACNLLQTRITPEILSVASSDYIRLISLYHKFKSLEDARIQMLERWSPCCVVHNDLNVANILVHEQWRELQTPDKEISNSALKIIDWERCSWGDPVLDVGNITANSEVLNVKTHTS